jgi:hypothetical protein
MNAFCIGEAHVFCRLGAEFYGLNVFNKSLSVGKLTFKFMFIIFGGRAFGGNLNSMGL